MQHDRDRAGRQQARCLSAVTAGPGGAIIPDADREREEARNQPAGAGGMFRVVLGPMMEGWTPPAAAAAPESGAGDSRHPARRGIMSGMTTVYSPALPGGCLTNWRNPPRTRPPGQLEFPEGNASTAVLPACVTRGATRR